MLAPQRPKRRSLLWTASRVQTTRSLLARSIVSHRPVHSCNSSTSSSTPTHRRSHIHTTNSSSSHRSTSRSNRPSPTRLRRLFARPTWSILPTRSPTCPWAPHPALVSRPATCLLDSHPPSVCRRVPSHRARHPTTWVPFRRRSLTQGTFAAPVSPRMHLTLMRTLAARSVRAVVALVIALLRTRRTPRTRLLSNATSAHSTKDSRSSNSSSSSSKSGRATTRVAPARPVSRRWPKPRRWCRPTRARACRLLPGAKTSAW
mmetsp:Transcript_10583/g.32557  ORF Transcript_10583/g.32557 Transcript_10583/m.32557 type:complete len:260 (-) Transcript_10583:572-1351(-)